MNKKFWKITVSCLVAGLILTTAGFLLPQQSVQSPAADRPSDSHIAQNTDEFTSLSINVKAADVIIQAGTDYSLEYQFSDKETVTRNEIINGTLALETETGLGWHPESGDWKVIVTIPEGKTLQLVDITTVSGDVIVVNTAITEGQLKSTSGEIEVRNITADTLNAENISDQISIRESYINTVEAENKSDTIEIEGTYDAVDIRTISGKIIMKGQINTEASLENVSGKIEIEAPFNTIHAESIKEIMINGQKQGRHFNLGQEGPELNVKSVSGKIEICTE